MFYHLIFLLVFPLKLIIKYQFEDWYIILSTVNLLFTDVDNLHNIFALQCSLVGLNFSL